MENEVTYARAAVVLHGRDGTLRRPSGGAFCGSGRTSEESERSISCHPELAKDLTASQAALCHCLPFSKLTALLEMPSVPKALKVKITSVRLREILRNLRMTAFGMPFSLRRPAEQIDSRLTLVPRLLPGNAAFSEAPASFWASKSTAHRRGTGGWSLQARDVPRLEPGNETALRGFASFSAFRSPRFALL